MKSQQQVLGLLTGALLVASVGLGCADEGETDEPYVEPPPRWPYDESMPIDIMNTVSTLQYYGPYLGFHHGVDTRAPAATPVYAPASGVVATRYYYVAKLDYTYEVSITTDDGLRWEVHHIDKPTIPQEIEDLAAQEARIEAGTYLGTVYDGALIGVESHIHINVLDEEAYYLNPLRFLPEVLDDLAPSFNEVYLLREDGDAYQLASDCTVTADPDRCILVLDAHDDINGSSWEHSLYQLDFYVQVGGDWQRVHGFEFDQLPDPNYRSGWQDIYWYEPFQDAQGNTVDNDVESLGDRRFLYRLPLEPVDLGSESSASEARVVLRDFAGNETEQTFSLAGR